MAPQTQVRQDIPADMSAVLIGDSPLADGTQQ